MRDFSGETPVLRTFTEERPTHRQAYAHQARRSYSVFPCSVLSFTPEAIGREANQVALFCPRRDRQSL